MSFRALSTIVAIAVLAACDETATPPTPAAASPTTQAHEPTTTTSESPTSTTSARLTTTTAADTKAIFGPFDAAAYAGNPVILQPGPQGGSFLPEVVYHEGIYHMWFTTTSDWSTVPTRIRHAVSEDGIDWTTDADPALVADGDGFDAASVAGARVIPTASGWVMYYNAHQVPGPGPGPAIGRATAPGPDGPWTRDPEPVLSAGDRGWDAGYVSPATVIATDDGISLYYSGGVNFAGHGPRHTGLARSTDGVTFEKIAEPVIVGSADWDGLFSWEAAVFPYDGGLAALYTGDPESLTGETIGYGWSADGVVWETARAPILEPGEQSWAMVDVVAGSVVETPDGRLLLYYSGNRSRGYSFAIGVAELVEASG